MILLLHMQKCKYQVEEETDEDKVGEYNASRE